MRIVLDTNVLVSGLLNPEGPPGRLLDILRSGELTLLLDDRILREYRSVLLRPKLGFAAADVAAVLEFLARRAERVTAAPVAARLPDPDDLPFLEVAVAGRADALVTGNARHFPPMLRLLGLRVMSPAALVRSWIERRG